MTSYIAGQRLERDFPQVQRSVYALSSEPVVSRGGEALPTEDVLLVDDLFFDVLRFPLVHGNPRTALSRPGTVVLTQSEARRLFGREDVLGQTLTMVSRGISTDYQVVGVARDLPRNSHIRFTIVARIDIPSFFHETPQFMTAWGWQSGWYYFTLRPGSDPAAIQAALPAWERRNIEDQVFGNQRTNQGDEQDWRVENIRDVHMGEAQEATMTPGNDRTTIGMFAVIAFLILGMACVNFTNLATARASQRAREVALRKVLGANRKQLITQFLAESVLIASIAMLLALALVELLLPSLASFLDATIEMHYFGAGGMLLPIVLLTLLVGAAGGVYPAFYLSRFQPAQVLKANKSTAEAEGSGLLRNVLVVAQFAVSIGLIICTAVVWAQNGYARNMDPGFRRSGLIQIENLGRRQLLERSDAIAEQMKRVPGVVSVGRSGIGVGTDNSNNTGVQVPGQAEPVNIGTYSIDPQFFETMGIELVAGRLFDENRPADRISARLPSDRGIAARPGRPRRQYRDQRAGGAANGFPEPGRRGRQVGPGRVRRGRIWRGADADHRRGSGFALPLDPPADRSDHVLMGFEQYRRAAAALRHRRSARRDAAGRAGLAPARARRAVRRRVQRGQGRRALRKGGGAGQGVRRLRDSRGDRRLPRRVRPRRLHRRAPDQGDRHQEGARRADPRHRQAARLAILQAGDPRHADRLAGRLAGDGRLAR